MKPHTSGRHLGIFEFNGSKLFGELKLAGPQSQLLLLASAPPSRPDTPETVSGELHDHTRISCVRCVGPSAPQVQTWGDSARYSWKIFPHLTLVGDRHFDDAANEVGAAWFTVTNAAEIFNDFDSYGVLPEQTVRTADVIPKMIGERVVPQGPEPKLAYFAGRRVLVDKAVEGAQIRVEHWPADGTKVPVGVALESKIMIGIIFSSPLHLEECLNAVMRLAQFLSLLAGRPQGVTDVQIYEKVDETLGDRPWLLHWSFAPEPEDSGEPDPPSFFDMPLDPIRRAGEFEQVLAGWWASHADAGLARARLHACRRKGNRFDTDRLVAAANMFDLRPVAVGDDVPPALAQARDLSVAAFKKLPRSDDRDSAIQALKRLGSPSLRKKVIARAKLVAVHFHLDRLDEVLRIAVWARNRFVHGAGDTTFDYEAVDPHTTFLTETLEFIFAAAELIECGWRAANWRSQPHSSSHWFARYLSGYAADMESLLAACERA